MIVVGRSLWDACRREDFPAAEHHEDESILNEYVVARCHGDIGWKANEEPSDEC